MLTVQQYTQQIFDLRQQYRDDNKWVGDWAESWNDEAVMTKFIDFAYKLYAATARNALQLTVLGGTEIRLEDSYIRNFGVTAANGIQDEATAVCVRGEQVRRRWVAKKGKNHHSARVAVTGVGSILSEKGWTPILNDSLILGAITCGQEFYLGLTPAEQSDWALMNGHKLSRVAVTAASYGQNPAIINAWKDFLNSQKRMFFFPWGGPRVFTRELLGLAFFGYQPEFSWHQLGFYPSRSGKRERPDFRTYLRKLREAGYQAPTDQDKVIQIISEFLFNDPRALGAPWPVTTKTAV